MEYFYIHVVSYYIGNNRDDNIIKAFKQLNEKALSKRQTENETNLLLVYVIFDELTNDIREKFEEYKKMENNNTKINILFRWNTGGTVQTLNSAYDYIVNNNIKCKYIGVWEDDACYNNKYFLDIVDNYLNEGYIFVGSLWGNYNGVKTLTPNNNRQVPWLTEKMIYPNIITNNKIEENMYMWCEDPYITTLTNLHKIKEKMNKFTLAPENEIYTHCQHGINYGEVGFPTRLHINGFKFIGLKLDEYFISFENKSIGNKNI